MSFSSDVKNDLLRIDEFNQAELKAMLDFSSEVTFGKEIKVIFSCNNLGVTRRFISLVKQEYPGMSFELLSRVINRLDNRTIYSCEIDLITSKMLVEDYNLLLSNDNEIEDEQDKIAYIRGAFLVKGSVNDPKSKTSHLEIASISENNILYLQKILNSFDFDARIAKRKNNLILYLKKKQSIGDFMYLIGVSTEMEYYENTIITKEIAATAKRTINLDVANQNKTNKAALEQLKTIEYIEYNYPLEKLDSKLLMVMKVRKENKESSLMELLDIIHEEYDPNLTKSGLNHRFRKLKEIEQEWKKSLNS
ncbi:MAG: DNA-binding protein WhiA [Acholeplasmatales bacterium]|nr:DNA-binding protein WhiA [Acholeplasmatales bacterium]